MIGPSGLLRASRIDFASPTGSFATLLKMYAASSNSASSASLFAPNIPHTADFSALFTTLFIASYLADLPFPSKVVIFGRPPSEGEADGVDFGVLGVASPVDLTLGLGRPPVEGEADGVDFGVLGVASPVDLTLGLGRIGSEKNGAGTGFLIVVDQKTAKIDDIRMNAMAVPVEEFSNQGYKIRKNFA